MTNELKVILDVIASRGSVPDVIEIEVEDYIPSNLVHEIETILNNCNDKLAKSKITKLLKG
jgi:hypothetical protein